MITPGTEGSMKSEVLPQGTSKFRWADMVWCFEQLVVAAGPELSVHCDGTGGRCGSWEVATCSKPLAEWRSSAGSRSSPKLPQDVNLVGGFPGT